MNYVFLVQRPFNIKIQINQIYLKIIFFFIFQEKVQQEDGQTALCLVESHIRLDYNTGEWKTFQNYRRLDQTNQSSGDSGGNVMQTQNSVVI